MTKAQEDLLNKVYEIVVTLQTGQTDILQEVDLKAKQHSTEESLSNLTARIN